MVPLRLHIHGQHTADEPLLHTLHREQQPPSPQHLRHRQAPALQPRSGRRKVRTNDGNQPQCRGCDVICELLREGEIEKRGNSAFRGTLPPRVMHASYRELDACATAGASACESCKVVRRALLLEQITSVDAHLLNGLEQWPVLVTLDVGGDAKGAGMLLVTIQPPNASKPTYSARVALTTDRAERMQEDPTWDGQRLQPDFAELGEVIRDCHENHECSSKFRWSSRNPSWLIEILDDQRLRLVPRSTNGLVNYVVLSYSWGDPTQMPKSEWARIKAAATQACDGVPVPERTRPFSADELPETMRDAISIASKLGFHYIWIDSVCIPKGSNWDVEASLAHEVYGNAAFTLMACSATKATDRLLQDRQAWLYRSRGCKLRGQWLANVQMSLDEVRLCSPVSGRSWTLQEERLSPRILYWTSQRWYFSCPERQVVELGQHDRPPLLPSGPCCSSPRSKGKHQKPPSWSRPHRFLELCRAGDEDQLHEEWLDVVEAYTRRDLVRAKDRFTAVSGLAVRFFDAKAESGKARVTEQYLAGLWADRMARHLAWSVNRAVKPDGSLQHIAPSWSWASLPIRSHVKTKKSFAEASAFRFIRSWPCEQLPMMTSESDITQPSLPLDEDSGYGSSGSNLNSPTSPAGWFKAQLDNLLWPESRGRGGGGAAAEERGRQVKTIQVRGRVRRFVGKGARKRSWRDIEWRRGERNGFDFSATPGQNVYARNLEDGRVVSKDGHGQEIVAQLDYLAPTGPVGMDIISDQSPAPTPPSSPSDAVALHISIHKRLVVSDGAPYLPHGAERDLVCLELGDMAMLLLAPVPGPSKDMFRRVGISVGYCNLKGFFYGCETRQILLV